MVVQDVKGTLDVREAYGEIATKNHEELGEVKAVTKAKIDEKFDPEKYGMIFCPDCCGSGRSFTNPETGNVCKVCGGFGLIKREKNDIDKREGPDQIASLRF